MTPDGERSFVADRGAADRLAPSDLQANWFTGADALHLALPLQGGIVLEVRRHHAHNTERRAQRCLQQHARHARPLRPGRVLAELLQHDKPLLARVEEIHWVDPEETTGPLWLGARGTRFAGADRQPLWLTGAEAGFLSRYARFSITAAWSAPEWGKTAVPAGFDLDPDDGLADHDRLVTATRHPDADVRRAAGRIKLEVSGSSLHLALEILDDAQYLILRQLSNHTGSRSAVRRI